MRIVALIPARKNSRRVPGKNTKLLAGKPLIQWTIEAAHDSGIFTRVLVSTEDLETADIASDVGDVWIIDRPPECSSDTAPDISWVRHAVEHHITEDAFAILRPTSPFRTAETIRRAYEQFSKGCWSSIRAVEPVKQDPGKMWQVNPHGQSMKPLIDAAWPAQVEGWHQLHPSGIPWHSQPTQSLPHVYVQNSSLEMAWTWCVTVFGTISGPKVAPFFTEGHEGFSIDYPEDWDRAEALAPSLLARV